MDALGAAVAHHAEPWHAGIGAKTVDLLVHGHQREQAVDPLLHCQCRIVEWIRMLLGEGRNNPRDEPREQKKNQNGRVLFNHFKHRVSFLRRVPGASLQSPGRGARLQQESVFPRGQSVRQAAPGEARRRFLTALFSMHATCMLGRGKGCYPQICADPALFSRSPRISLSSATFGI